MAASITLQIGAKSFTFNFTKPDAEVRVALRRFGRMHEPPLPDTATIQEEIDDIGMKLIKVIERDSKRFRLSELVSEQTTDLEQQADTESKL